MKVGRTFEDLEESLISLLWGSKWDEQTEMTMVNAALGSHLQGYWWTLSSDYDWKFSTILLQAVRKHIADFSQEKAFWGQKIRQNVSSRLRYGRGQVQGNLGCHKDS